jgi:hypothetical protein
MLAYALLRRHTLTYAGVSLLRIPRATYADVFAAAHTWRLLTYADVCAVAHGGGGRVALHTGALWRLYSIKALLRLYSGSLQVVGMLLYTQVFIAFLAIQALLRLYQGRILLYTQAFVFVIKVLWRLYSIKALLRLYAVSCVLSSIKALLRLY